MCCTGWTEVVPLPAREQSLVVAGLEAIGQQLPFPVKGIDSDNDSVFINETLVKYCAERGIEFARSRPYRKNDQAWIEQKSGAVVRHFVGHDRYSGSVAGQTMVSPVRGGATVRELLPAVVQVGGENSARPQGDQALQSTSHALRSPHAARRGQRGNERRVEGVPGRVGPGGAAARHPGSPVGPGGGYVSRIRPTPSGESLGQFLAKLPDLWRQDAAHTSRERRMQPPRTWRTRPDPFEGVWCDVLSWLQEDSDASAVVLLGRLQEAEPDRFSRAHLRTLQRRVQQWRGIMAKKLVYAAAGEPMAGLPAMPELALVGADPRC